MNKEMVGEKMKKAFVFPGQGSQKVGMMQDLYNEYQVVRDTFAKADEVLGYSIKEMCFAGPEESLRQTANTQPAILTASVACYEVLKEKGFTPDIVGGHSLGEYSALVAAGALKFEDAVLLVHKRGKFMQEAVPVGVGAMAAIIGLAREDVISACENAAKETNSTVQAVNFNCPGQIVIAGETKAVELAAEQMKEAGAKRAVILPVSAPFHSKLMEPAGLKLKEELDKIEIYDTNIPVVANINGEMLTNGDEIKASLVKQASSPVLWEDCIQTIQEFGAEKIVEVGPGKVLSGFNRRIDRKIKSSNVEDIASLEKTVAFLEGE